MSKNNAVNNNPITLTAGQVPVGQTSGKPIGATITGSNGAIVNSSSGAIDVKTSFARPFLLMGA